MRVHDHSEHLISSPIRSDPNRSSLKLIVELRLKTLDLISDQKYIY